jgi:DNA-binding SARP family transcriptional activator
MLTKPTLSATRDQVLEALWPDLEPDTAMNSLNQTIYFLRRIFEPNYHEDVSPGYVHHDSDVVWLDPELVTSESVECMRLVESFGRPATYDDVAVLSMRYTGRYALDFTYEDWASAHRNTLHSAYLELVEAKVSEDVRTGRPLRALDLARRAVAIDPEAESIERLLLKLYKQTGAHAAAAEQYAHYAAAMRSDLGLDPPKLDEL